MTKMTRKVALTMAISALTASDVTTMRMAGEDAEYSTAEAVATLSKLIEQLDAKASKSSAYADKVKARECAERAELGKALASAITSEPMTLTELIKASGLDLSTQKAVRCLAEIGVGGVRVKGKVVYMTTKGEAE